MSLLKSPLAKPIVLIISYLFLLVVGNLSWHDTGNENLWQLGFEVLPRGVAALAALYAGLTIALKAVKIRVAIEEALEILTRSFLLPYIYYYSGIAILQTFFPSVEEFISAKAVVALFWIFVLASLVFAVVKKVWGKDQSAKLALKAAFNFLAVSIGLLVAVFVVKSDSFRWFLY